MEQTNQSKNVTRAITQGYIDRPGWMDKKKTGMAKFGVRTAAKNEKSSTWEGRPNAKELIQRLQGKGRFKREIGNAWRRQTERQG